MCLIEHVPTNHAIKRYRCGTCVRTGKRGAEVRMDDEERVYGAVWLQDSQLHFVVKEAQDGNPPEVSRERPVQRTSKSSIAKQLIEEKAPPMPPKPNTPDPLGQLRANGIDPLAFYEALGRSLEPDLVEQVKIARGKRDDAAKRHASATALAEKLRKELEVAEGMRKEAEVEANDATLTLENAEARLRRVRG